MEKLGGKRGAQSLAGILEDFSSVEKAMTTMENAAGSANREMGIIQESLDYKINKLKETWVGFLQETIQRDSLKNWVDGFTKASEVITNLASNFGVLKTAIVGMFTVIGSQKLG